LRSKAIKSSSTATSKLECLGEEIERRIARADVVIPLLSAASVQSEMLAFEIQWRTSTPEARR